MRHWAAITALIFLAGCVTGGPQKPSFYYNKYGITPPVPAEFSHCHGYGCRLVDTVSMSENEWKPVDRIFKNNKTAEDERASIAAAIGTLEKIVGGKTGTSEDTRGTYVAMGGNNQHDCIDESTNTTLYLDMLEQRGLLEFYEAASPTTRLPLIGGRIGPHRTAVITEKESGERYAVDSWFHDNGQDAEIIALSRWYRGWQPDKKPIEQTDKDK